MLTCLMKYYAEKSQNSQGQFSFSLSADKLIPYISESQKVESNFQSDSHLILINSFQICSYLGSSIQSLFIFMMELWHLNPSPTYPQWLSESYP